MSLTLDELEVEFRACKERLKEMEEKYSEVLTQLARVTRELNHLKELRCPLWQRVDELEERYQRLQFDHDTKKEEPGDGGEAPPDSSGDG
jgi:chromosome segregation ATPase